MNVKKYKIVPDVGEVIDIPNTIVKTSKTAEEYARKFYHEDIGIYESVFIMLLNRANKVIGWAKISQGGVVGTVVDPILIAKYAIDSLAKGVIMVHNHPSGNCTPSKADIDITTKVGQGLKLFDVEVIDHLILTTDGYYSFRDEGLL